MRCRWECAGYLQPYVEKVSVMWSLRENQGAWKGTLALNKGDATPPLCSLLTIVSVASDWCFLAWLSQEQWAGLLAGCLPWWPQASGMRSHKSSLCSALEFLLCHTVFVRDVLAKGTCIRWNSRYSLHLDLEEWKRRQKGSGNMAGSDFLGCLTAATEMLNRCGRIRQIFKYACI